MMALPTELSLDCKPNIGSLVLKSYEETEKLEEFIAHLEEEKLKINGFKRELPLCMQLLTNAMEATKQELQSHRMKAGARPVAEEFISLQNSTASSSSSSDKANWMASATLWNQESPELGVDEDGEACRREKSVGNKEKRKTRRCWSPHLHTRFLNALHMLGGSQRATPKQITQLMKVDGLTTDEVKSHLQKYRLHTRIQTPSPLLVVGGIWVPPEYAHGGAATAPRITPPSSLDYSTCSFMRLN